ncbi:LutC/YkgG family protein [Myroides injenensis]|uniref:LutC/YkgG family protein n=1 Tax=Myroides injenensis TaxID=1183151 RepID=UPI000287D551|nr:LUD domain-containing protein [Myroides injenensis]
MSKDQILQSIKRNIQQRYDKPEIALEAIRYDNLLEQFIEITKGVGGEAILLQPDQDINQVIKGLYNEANVIASNLDEITINTINPDDIADSHQLDNVDLAIVRGEFGVGENGCVWIPQNVRHKALYFISQYLIIVLDKNELVNNMHEAYARLKVADKGFGIFISGPSKTADIEQALVVGAHGPKGLTVILK